MKKLSLLTLFAVTIVAVSSCKKEENNNPSPGNTGDGITIDAKQRTLLMDYTATWCGPCGANGTPTFKNIMNTHADKVIGFAFHTGSSELTPFYIKNDSAFIMPLFSTIFPQSGIQTNSQGSFGIPAYSLNQAQVSISESGVKSAVDANYAKTPLAGVGVSATKTANGVDINAKVKFFDASSGEYYLSYLLLEDHIDHRQNVGSAYVNSFLHEHILRGSALGTRQTPNVWGNVVANGSVTKDQEIKMDKVSYTHDMTLVPSRYTTLNKWPWKPENTSVAAILWKKTGTSYTFVNGTVVKIK